MLRLFVTIVAFVLVGFALVVHPRASAQASPTGEVLGRSMEGVVVRTETTPRSVVCVVHDDGSFRCSNDRSRPLRRGRSAIAGGAGMFGIAGVVLGFALVPVLYCHSDDCRRPEPIIFATVPFVVASAGLFAFGGARIHRLRAADRLAFDVVGWSDPNGLAFGRGLALRGTF